MSGKLRVGINGLGRIGRAFFRINLENDIFEIPIINDINKDIENIAYTLNYDSIYGKLNPPIKTNINKLLCNYFGNLENTTHNLSRSSGSLRTTYRCNKCKKMSDVIIATTSSSY